MNSLEPLGFDTVVDESLRLPADERKMLLRILGASVATGAEVVEAALNGREPTLAEIHGFEAAEPTLPFEEPTIPRIFIVFGTALAATALLFTYFGYVLGQSDAQAAADRQAASFEQAHPFYGNPGGIR